MQTSIREKNLAFLGKLRPDLLELYESGGNDGVETVTSKSSLPVFRYRGTAFHSLYKPEEEAARFVNTLKKFSSDVEKAWVFGMGYAHHLRSLMDNGVELTVFEPSEEIFRSAVDNADIADVIERCRIVVGSGFVEAIRNADLKNGCLLIHRPYLRFFESEFLKIESAFVVRSYLREKGLRVMLVGPIYGGSETTFRYAAAALENLGVDVSLFDASEFAPAYLKLDGVTSNDVHRRQLKSIFSGMLGEAVLARADHIKPDLIVVMAQAPLEISAMQRLKKLKTPIAYWFVENFHSMKYWEEIAPMCDYFFTIQRGEFFEKLKAAHVRNVSYLPQAASPAHHRPLRLNAADREHYGSNLSFMGAGYPNRQHFFHGLLDYDFKVWGTEWDLNSEVGLRLQNKNVRLEPGEYIKIFSASRINLNLHSSTMHAGIDPVGDFVNPRVFEIAACGGFSLVDNRDELPPLMEPGREIETFSTLAELREKVEYYLGRQDDRRKIAQAGRKRVLEDHTFEYRMEELLKIIILNEGDSLGGGAEKKYPRNVVKNMMEEGADDAELVKFLENFNPIKKFNIEKAVEKINGGNGALDRAELILLMMNQLQIPE